MTWLPRRACFLGLWLLAAAWSPAARAEVLGQISSVAIGSAPVRIVLTDGPALAIRVRALPAGHKLFLVIRRLHAASPPGVLYNLFLDLDAGAALPADGDPRTLGTINFFAAVPPGGDVAAVSFDITQNLRAVAAKGGLTRGMPVTIVPMETPAPGAGTVLGSVELVAEH